MNRWRARLLSAMRRLPFQVAAFTVLAVIVVVCVRFWQVGLAVLIWILISLVVVLVLLGGRRNRP